MKMEKRYWAPIESRFGKFAAWIDGEGRLLRFHLRLKGAEHVDRYAERNDRALKDVQKQIAQYDAGKRRDFEFIRVADGTSFQNEVWEALVRIPYGETTSYGALAQETWLSEWRARGWPRQSEEEPAPRPHCGAPTPTPEPSRISYFSSNRLITSNRAVIAFAAARSKRSG
jgi:hypothetical protein